MPAICFMALIWAAPPTRLTETLLVPKAEEFTARIDGCTAAGSFSGWLSPGEVRRQFEPVYRFLLNKWYFDELYDWLFVRPTHLLAGCAAWFDRRWIDWFVDGLASTTAAFARIWERIACRLMKCNACKN